MLPRSVTLHVGLQKTGTTMIQRTLRGMRDHLASSGVVYLDRQEMNDLPAHGGWRAFPEEPFVEALIPFGLNLTGFHEPDDESRFTQQLRELAEARCREALEATGRAPDRLLMSNESLVGRVAPDFGHHYRPRAESAIEHVLEALEPERTSLILYVRRQDALLESQYMQQVHAGEATSFGEWALAALRRPYIRFSELAGRLEAIATVESLVVRPFETIRAGADRFVADLIARVGADGGLGEMDIPISNQSYSAPALEAALAINPLLDDESQVPRVRKFLRKVFPREDYPPPQLFSAKQRRAVLDMYANDNRELFRKYVPGADEDAYLSDAGTEGLADLLD